MASTLSLRFLVPGFQRPHFLSRKNPNPKSYFSTKSSLSSSSSSSSSPSWEREEARWLREEQRWLREEQRWLKEESRWNAEREILLREVSALRLLIESLQHPIDAPGTLPAPLREPPSLPAVLPVTVKEVVLLDEVRVSEKKGKVKRNTLRMGSQGDEVQEMQEALQRLGFYSGEEDMEYSSFSTGTERAVKTWQASLGTPEDGIMTAELLEMLFLEREGGLAGLHSTAVPRGDSTSVRGNDGVSVAAVSSTKEIQQMVTKGSSESEVEVSHHRVYLLGENRWEEPSRLVGRNNKPTSGSKHPSATKCLSCRGEGQLLCEECDGTGEPNIEPQFVEWIGDGAKCPYCEGRGHTICDDCKGSGNLQT